LFTVLVGSLLEHTHSRTRRIVATFISFVTIVVVLGKGPDAVSRYYQIDRNHSGGSRVIVGRVEPSCCKQVLRYVKGGNRNRKHAGRGQAQRLGDLPVLRVQQSGMKKCYMVNTK